MHNFAFTKLGTKLGWSSRVLDSTSLIAWGHGPLDKWSNLKLISRGPPHLTDLLDWTYVTSDLDWVVGWLYDILSCLLTSWGVCASATELSFCSKWRPQRSEGSLNEECCCCKIDTGFKGWELQVSPRAPVDNSYSNVAGISRKKVVSKRNCCRLPVYQRSTESPNCFSQMY